MICAVTLVIHAVTLVIHAVIRVTGVVHDGLDLSPSQKPPQP
jgi:hypothetical protein